MGFWDEPTTLLDPATNLPLMGRQTLVPALIKRVATSQNRTVIGNITANKVSYEEIPIAAGATYMQQDSIRLTAAGGFPGAQPVVPFYGTTAQRPTGLVIDGGMFFDTTLGKPVFRKAASATGWCDATGADV
ncbi:hypothetical protein SEA_BEE17_27 [Microbacterium phage Bee17]|nr:hypothetical protein SEA_BEE17_27 [Microbacterium phage Bee17]